MSFQLTSVQWLPRTPDEIFDYFSDALNLEHLTPPWLQFRVLTPGPINIHAGVEIDYSLKMRGIPLRWRSRIATWEPTELFIDEQISGPYRLWRHEHVFAAEDGGTSVTDRVQYQVVGGRLTNSLFIRRDLLTIFQYRQIQLSGLFGNDPQKPSDIRV